MSGISEVAFTALFYNTDRPPRSSGNSLDARGTWPSRDRSGIFGDLSGLLPFINSTEDSDAVSSDVVYMEWSLHRSIMRLMEPDHQSNFAPPASHLALEKLQKKNLDRKMVADSTKMECTICLNEVRLGDEVTVLPCQHWFQGECVGAWLKQHNTCPLCRAPIEKRDQNRTGNRNGHGRNGDEYLVLIHD
jgi:hypothetical protein